MERQPVVPTDLKIWKSMTLRCLRGLVRLWSPVLPQTQPLAMAHLPEEEFLDSTERETEFFSELEPEKIFSSLGHSSPFVAKRIYLFQVGCFPFFTFVTTTLCQINHLNCTFSHMFWVMLGIMCESADVISYVTVKVQAF